MKHLKILFGRHPANLDPSEIIDPYEDRGISHLSVQGLYKTRSLVRIIGQGGGYGTFGSYSPQRGSGGSREINNSIPNNQGFPTIFLPNFMFTHVNCFGEGVYEQFEKV